MLEFDVYAMDVIPEGDGLWTENNRHRIGRISVPAKDIDDLTDQMILKAMSEFRVSSLFGEKSYAISTTDRRRVYAEDYFEDGTWWEVGIRKGHEPVYGLRLIEEAV